MDRPQKYDGPVRTHERVLAQIESGLNAGKWPIGDPLKEEFHFCGNDSPEASPYCSFHARLAYQPSAERRRMR